MHNKNQYFGIEIILLDMNIHVKKVIFLSKIGVKLDPFTSLESLFCQILFTQGRQLKAKAD